MTSTEVTLHVVTHRGWVAADLTDGAAALDRLDHLRDPGGQGDLGGSGRRVRVAHHLGFDLPHLAPGDAIWAPMETAARIAAQDPRLRLADPGPEFLTVLPREFTGRRVELLTVADMDARIPRMILDDGPLVFAKPANCKIETFPATWDDYDGHGLHATSMGIPADQRFLVTKTRLDLDTEIRLFVLDGQVVTYSPYLAHGADGPGGSQTTWHESMTTPHATAAVEFGSRVLAWLAGSGHPVPRTFTLDVGVLTDGTWVVIEANPVWSSAYYGANLAAVVACLLAATTITGTTTGTTTDTERYASPAPGEWVPDPYLVLRIAQQRPLPTAPPRSHR